MEHPPPRDMAFGNCRSCVRRPQVQLGKEKDILGDMAGAAQRQGGIEKARNFFDENPEAARYANWVGVLLSLVLFGWGVRQQSRLWARGVRPF